MVLPHPHSHRCDHHWMYPILCLYAMLLLVRMHEKALLLLLLTIFGKLKRIDIITKTSVSFLLKLFIHVDYNQKCLSISGHNPT